MREAYFSYVDRAETDRATTDHGNGTVLACAGPRCPFARLLGTARGRASLIVLLVLGLVHYFAPDPVSLIAGILMWALAIGLSAWVLIPRKSPRPK